MSDYSHSNIFREAGVAYKANNEADKVKMVRAGVLKESIERLSEITTIPVKDLVGILPVSERQFNRYDNRTRLKKDLSEHILIVADVLLKSLEIFDSPEQLREWFFTPQIALGSEKPISLLDTSFGATLVTDLLGRLEHGVIS
ncbi:DUF2384 domain-containing protein [soil metagenome]